MIFGLTEGGVLETILSDSYPITLSQHSGSIPEQAIGAQGFFVNKHTTLSHCCKPVRHFNVAAVGKNSFKTIIVVPFPAAAYSLSIERHAEDKSIAWGYTSPRTCRHGDSWSNSYENTEGPGSLLSIRFLPGPIPDYHFSSHGSSELHESAAITMPCGVPESRPGRLPSLNG